MSENESSRTPIRRRCKTCRQPFEITLDELRWWQDFGDRTGQAWHLPMSCTACRVARRHERLAVPADTPIQWYERECEDCGEVFRIGPRDVQGLIERRWEWPRRCRSCRIARQAQVGP